MELELEGQRVTQERVDFALSLRTDAGYEVRIETDFSMHTPNGDFEFSLGATSLEPDKFPSLLDQTITASKAEESGALVLAFGNGTSLRVEPHEEYEAWTIAGPHGKKIVCMPHGELAVWSE
jgi:hypothetical protein